jgi:outer membrane protein OmpA-like peptidoglycan-associated protein
VSDVVETREACGGFAAALVIEDGAQVGDDGESVIEFFEYPNSAERFRGGAVFKGASGGEFRAHHGHGAVRTADERHTGAVVEHAAERHSGRTGESAGARDPATSGRSEGAEGRLVISLREIGFYESGSATLRASSRDALDRLAAILEKRSESMRIEGHTDNIPIHNARFASNWELSTSRGSELIRVFVERYRMDPARLSAAEYAEFHPVAANDTAEGRARNRRVDIVVLNPPPFPVAIGDANSRGDPK